MTGREHGCAFCNLQVQCDQLAGIIEEEEVSRPPIVSLNVSSPPRSYSVLPAATPEGCRLRPFCCTTCPQGEALIRVPYGEKLTQNLGWCQSLEDEDCGAYAVQEIDGVASTPSDLVILSPSCRLEDAAEGTCLPGAYGLKYQAFDDEGRVSGGASVDAFFPEGVLLVLKILTAVTCLQASNIVSRVLVVERRAVVQIAMMFPLPGDPPIPLAANDRRFCSPVAIGLTLRLPQPWDLQHHSDSL